MDLRRDGWAWEVDTELRYRNGEGNHLSAYVIDGDGLVSAVTFAPGRPVRVRSRHVRTLWDFGCVYAPRSRLEAYCGRRGGSTEHVRSIRIPRRFMVHDFAMARAVADGPVCTLPAPESLGYSFHGQWTQARP